MTETPGVSIPSLALLKAKALFNFNPDEDELFASVSFTLPSESKEASDSLESPFPLSRDEDTAFLCIPGISRDE